MCGIVGVVSTGLDAVDLISLQYLIDVTKERGTDAFGVRIVYPNRAEAHDVKTLGGEVPQFPGTDLPIHLGEPIIILGNVRAEPTTEWVEEPTLKDVHPFVKDSWAVVHNGTIANDAAIRSQADQQPYSTIDSAVLPGLFAEWGVTGGLSQIKGSYALLAHNMGYPDSLHVACNYKPLYAARRGDTLWFASQRKYLDGSVVLPHGSAPWQVPPYSVWECGINLVPNESIYLWNNTIRRPPIKNGKVLVICSGGLDSTVAAAMIQRARPDAEMEILHFQYACRAQEKEFEAVVHVAGELGVPLRVIPVEALFGQIAGATPLLNKEPAVHGDAGAEFAHEWVPARNLIFLSLATALAESLGVDYLALGNNLEEAGAYPDNEMEFIVKFNDLLPYAIASTSRVEVLDPIGNLMKHQIVKKGLEIGAPMHVTWSCYEAGERHCGQCGPCRMRRVAFKMNGEEDPVEYETALSR